MGLRRRNGWWQTTIGGRRVSLKTKDRTVAVERERHALLVATNPARFSRLKLMQALDDIITRSGIPAGTRQHYEVKARALVRGLGDVLLSSVNRVACVAYVEARKRDGVSQHTVRKELMVLRVALREAKARGEWAGDASEIVPSVKANYVARERTITEHEERELMARLPSRRMWLALAIHAGLRLSELHGLEWRDVRDGMIHVRGTKTERSKRMVPISAALAPYLATRGAPNGRVVKVWHKSQRDLTMCAARINGWTPDPGGRGARRAKVQHHPPLTANDLRRTFGSRLIRAGVSTFVVAKLMGNSVAVVERTYAHLLAVNLRDAIACVDSVQSPRQNETPKAPEADAPAPDSSSKDGGGRQI